jgi:hypothetical protein
LSLAIALFRVLIIWLQSGQDLKAEFEQEQESASARVEPTGGTNYGKFDHLEPFLFVGKFHEVFLEIDFFSIFGAGCLSFVRLVGVEGAKFDLNEIKQRDRSFGQQVVYVSPRIPSWY